jgi:hypothetical protein
MLKSDTLQMKAWEYLRQPNKDGAEDSTETHGSEDATKARSSRES